MRCLRREWRCRVVARWGGSRRLSMLYRWSVWSISAWGTTNFRRRLGDRRPCVLNRGWGGMVLRDDVGRRFWRRRRRPRIIRGNGLNPAGWPRSKVWRERRHRRGTCYLLGWWCGPLLAGHNRGLLGKDVLHNGKEVEDGRFLGNGSACMAISIRHTPRHTSQKVDQPTR